MSHCLEDRLLKLFKCLILSGFVFFASLAGLASDNNPTSNQPPPQRQDIVKIAYNGLYYFLYQAQKDPSFRASLTPDELKMLEGLEAILEQASALRWFKEKQIKHYENTHHINGHTQKSYTFAYSDLLEEVVRFDSLYLEAPSLVFSNDRARFKELKPGEPERMGKTFPEFSKAIEINLFRLNDSAIQFDLGHAVALLVHEYGHKLDQAKIQGAVDGLANKLGDFIRSQVTTHDLHNGQKLFSLSFKHFDMAHWLDFGFFRGTYDFVLGAPKPFSLPMPQNRLPIFSGQGLYLWSQFNGEVTDLTKDFLKQVTKKNIIHRDYAHEKFYHFADQIIYNADLIEITPSAEKSGSFKIKINMAQIGVQQPFMIPTVSPDPQKAKLVTRYYSTQMPYYVEPLTGEIPFSYNGSHFSFQPVKEKSKQKVYSVEGKASIVSVKKEANKLSFQIKIEQSPTARDSYFNKSINLNAVELEIKTKEGVFLLTSTSFDATTAVATFEINNIDKVEIKDLDISRIYLKKSTNDTLDPSLQARLEVALFDPLSVPVTAENPNRPALPQSIPLELKSIAPATKDQAVTHLALQSSEKIRSLGLKLAIRQSHTGLLEITQENEYALRKTTGTFDSPTSLIDLVLTEDQFQQKLQDGKLYISFNLSKLYQFVSAQQISHDINQHQIHMKNIMFKFTAPEAQLKQISVLTEPLQLKSIELSTPTQIYLDIFAQWPERTREFYKTLSRGEIHQTILAPSCKNLFN